MHVNPAKAQSSTQLTEVALQAVELSLRDLFPVPDEDQEVPQQGRPGLGTLLPPFPSYPPGCCLASRWRGGQEACVTCSLPGECYCPCVHGTDMLV